MSHEKTREMVSEAYAKALQQSQGCCGGGAPASNAAKLAGYGAEMEQATSFGCGNPLAFAGVEERETVLDLGSGAGLDLLIAAEKVGPAGRVIGVDMTDAMIEKARENVARAGFDNVEVRKGIIEKLPVDDASVDWVISNCVINLSPEKDRVFKEIARVLRPGGRISVSDIVVEELPKAIREHAVAYSACIAGAISEEQYVAGLRAAGLEDVAVDERLVYTADQLRGLVGGELPEAPFEEVAGKVWSARFAGRRSRPGR